VLDGIAKVTLFTQEKCFFNCFFGAFEISSIEVDLYR